MSFNKNQIRQVIETVLKDADTYLEKPVLYSVEAVELLMGTMAVETDFGTNLYQVGGGSGQGFFQMEEDTEKDIWKNYLKYKDVLRCTVCGYCGVNTYNEISDSINSLGYQILMARIHYLRVKEALPVVDYIFKGEGIELEVHTMSILAMAEYWKKYYNTYKGKGTVANFINKYDKYCR